MKTTTVLCLALATAAFAGPASAVFKCTTAKGVVYQDRPCREGSETDVRIVIPTGEMAPKSTATADGAMPTGNTGSENRTQSATLVRYNADGTAIAKPTDRPASEATDGARRKEASPGMERTAPLLADQARKSEPTAKYYATESFGTGSETPTQMNCESPSGEKRVFYLSNGKLTSI